MKQSWIETYKGQWYLNKRHGQGQQRYSDGAIYIGDWVQDKRQGHGEIKYPDSTTYEVTCLKSQFS